MKNKILVVLSVFVIGIFLTAGVWAVELVECKPPPVSDCLGGSCSYLDSFGDCCTACCTITDKPTCDATGCRCS